MKKITKLMFLILVGFLLMPTQLLTVNARLDDPNQPPNPDWSYFYGGTFYWYGGSPHYGRPALYLSENIQFWNSRVNDPLYPDKIIYNGAITIPSNFDTFESIYIYFTILRYSTYSQSDKWEVFSYSLNNPNGNGWGYSIIWGWDPFNSIAFSFVEAGMRIADGSSYMHWNVVFYPSTRADIADDTFVARTYLVIHSYGHNRLHTICPGPFVIDSPAFYAA